MLGLGALERINLDLAGGRYPNIRDLQTLGRAAGLTRGMRSRGAGMTQRQIVSERRKAGHLAQAPAQLPTQAPSGAGMCINRAPDAHREPAGPGGTRRGGSGV